MKKLLLLAIISFFCKSGFSQTAVDDKKRAEALNDPKFIEFKKRHDDVTKNNQALNAPVSSYFGYEEKLKTYFPDNYIPSQTPKSDGFSSKTEYVKVLNDWISKNKHLLKPEHKNSLITE